MTVCITGMHRSGTSMVTRLLNICGLYLGPEERLIPPREDNLAGFWENLAVYTINETILEQLGGGWDYLPSSVKAGWERNTDLGPLRDQARRLIKAFSEHEPWGWKDPRFCFTLPFWQSLLPDIKVIICLRHPLAVAKSLVQRNGHSPAFSLHLWLEHIQHLLEHTRPEQRLVTHYDTYFTDPLQELRRVVAWLGWSVPEETVSRACESISQGLRHHDGSDRHGRPADLPTEVDRPYRALMSEAGPLVAGGGPDPKEARNDNDEEPTPGPGPQPPDERSPTVVTEPSATPVTSARPTVSIVMLTYNALEYTQRCMDSLRQHTNYPHEVIFVENGSTDGTKDYLKDLVAANSNYRLIDNETNIGFSAGNNQGVKEASGQYVLLLNNDVLVADGWLEGLVSTLERDERIGMVGPVTNYVSGRQRLAPGGSTGSPEMPYQDDEGFYGFAKTVQTANRGKVTPRRRIAGFAILIRKDLYDALGGLDEDFGSGNYEDDDLCLRVREQGCAIMVDESTYIHHFGSRSFTDNKIDYHASLKENEKVFRAKWPDVDLDWLLEKEESLARILERKANEAIQMINQGDLVKGRDLCEEVLLEDPTRLEAVYGLGLIAHLEGDLREARKHYQRAVRLNREWTPAQQSLALLDVTEGDIKAAQLRLAQVLEKNPRDLDARRLLGQACLKGEQFEEGIGLLMGILKDDPNDWQTHFILASVYAEVDRVEDVVRHLEAVLASNPDHAQAREMLDKITSE